MSTQVRREWLKPNDVARLGLILNSKGKPADRQFIVKLVKEGKLKARVWAKATYKTGKQYPSGRDYKQAERSYFLIARDEIDRYNESLEAY